MANNPFVFILIGVGITALLVYYILIRKPSRASHMETSQVRRNRQALGDDECCICLA
jgi:hypothetical protein